MHKPRISLGVFMLFVLCVAPAVGAPLATEFLGPTTLTIAPVQPYDRAIVRIAGPNGLMLRAASLTGAPFTIDLQETYAKAALERSSRRESSLRPPPSSADLPDGRYRYEVVFVVDGARHGVHTGLFFVQEGSTVSRDTKRAELGEMREQLARKDSSSGEVRNIADAAYELNHLAVVDYDDDGITFLALDSDYPGYPNQYVSIVNGLGTVGFYSGYGLSSYPMASLGAGGHLQLGYTGVLEFSGIYTEWYIRGGGDDDFSIDVTLWPPPSFEEIRNIITIEDDEVGGTRGNVGIHHADPAARLHVSSPGDGSAKVVVEETAGPATVREMFKLVNNGGPFFIFADTSLNKSWAFASLATNDFTMNQQQSPNIELRLNAAGTLTLEGTLVQGSSREFKKDILPIDPEGLLDRVAALPLAEWSYNDEDGVRHIGPMAEDFRAAFGFGADDRTLAPSDVGGVALAAIQAVHARVERILGANEALAQQLAAREAHIVALEMRLAALEALARRDSQR